VDFLSENLEMEATAMRILCFQSAMSECRAESAAAARPAADAAPVADAETVIEVAGTAEA
jgi:hypothetical protein